MVPPMWTKLMNRPRKRAPKKIAVIDPERCFGAFACSICQAACPVEDCIIEEPDAYGRMVCAVRVDKCIGCGLCVTVGNPTAPQPRDFGWSPGLRRHRHGGLRRRRDGDVGSRHRRRDRRGDRAHRSGDMKT